MDYLQIYVSYNYSNSHETRLSCYIKNINAIYFYFIYFIYIYIYIYIYNYVIYIIKWSPLQAIKLSYIYIYITYMLERIQYILYIPMFKDIFIIYHIYDDCINYAI